MLLEFTEDELIELEFLRDQEIDAMIENEHLDATQRFDDELRSSFRFAHKEMILDIKTGMEYPVYPLEFTVENISLPRLVVDALRISLRRIVEVGNTKNNYKSWQSRKSSSFGLFEPHMVALEVVQETTSHLKAYRESLPKVTEITKCLQKLKFDDVTTIDQLLHSDGLDLSSISARGPAARFFGKTVEDLCRSIPTRYRILHVEPVIRSDLQHKFLQKQLEMRERLEKVSIHALRKSVPMEHQRRIRDTEAERQELINFLVSPKLTFHGTQNHIVPSIVKHGFLLPDDLNPSTGESHEVRCGSTYGRGIYSSPDASFSLSYTGYGATPTSKDEFGGLKLIICATLMGISAQLAREDNWRDQSQPYANADSHVANRQYEYTVFDRRQIVPCYVVHLDWGRDNKEDFLNIPLNPAMWIASQKVKVHPKLVEPILSPGEKQAAKKALMAKALKYFPYGYGPATGTRFVIEEIADTSEDDEDYGEYQADRIEKGDDYDKDSGNVWSWSTNHMTKLDQYSAEKHAKIVKQVWTD